MRHKGLFIGFIILVLFGGSFLFGMVVYFLSGSKGTCSSWPLGGNVGIVTVDGAIVSADETVEAIDDFQKDDDIKSVILRIESPGGSVAASQEIFEATAKLAKKKPVVASMGSVAASGGYYIACGASKILANPGTITGSIGVRMEHVMVSDLLKWVKIGHETLKSGKFKDLAAFDRPMTPEERAILQGMLDDIHVQFKEAVATARGLNIAMVDEIADGRVYTGRQALELKLVDELGGFTEAVKRAGELGGIKGEPKLVHQKKKHFFERMLNSAEESFMGKVFGLADYWQPLLMMQRLSF